MANNRYAAQTRLPEIGNEGMAQLRSSSVLIVGCGALGSPVAMYLAAAGIGHIILADFDTIDISNLQRQVFFKESETGLEKASILKSRIRELNSEVRVTVWNFPVTAKRLNANTERIDLIVDAADNPATTYLLDRFCFEKHLPLSTAGVTGWNAQIASYLPGETPFKDIFSAPSDQNDLLPCSIAGVFGPLTGLVASIQASEAIKLLLSKGTSLAGKLMTINLLTNDFNIFPIESPITESD